MVWWFVHSSKLVCYWMCPEVAKKQRTSENKKGSVSSTLGSFHLDGAYGLHVEIQDHNKKDDCYERHDERRPRLYFTLQWKQTHFKQDCSPLDIIYVHHYSIKSSLLSLCFNQSISSLIFSTDHIKPTFKLQKDKGICVAYLKYLPVLKSNAMCNAVLALFYYASSLSMKS